MLVGFHPLKSGRNEAGWSGLCTELGVSIPSSRVGTVFLSDVASVFLIGFHPLKSGRNRLVIVLLRCPPKVSIPSSRVGTAEHITDDDVEALVSIPSSRVGTRFLRSFRQGGYRFPSPQVGSEPGKKGVLEPHFA